MATQQDFDRVPIPHPGTGSPINHLFDEQSRWAILAALAANRPLLVRGDPGVGKSQLAHAAAIALKRPFLSLVVNARTESQDLLYAFDAVSRLAKAQICSAIMGGSEKEEKAKDRELQDLLAESNFVNPGKLWWAFNWETASTQAKKVGAPHETAPGKWKSGDGCVLLIDEIDKAESDVPNGLLEALGSHSFPVRGCEKPIAVTGQPPLVVITTNEDRVLPNAFVRRCLVLHIELPEGEKLKKLLLERGVAHQPDMDQIHLAAAADELIQARNAQKHVRPRPGQAEYLDLIRAMNQLVKDEQRKPKGEIKLTEKQILDNVKGFVLKKNAGSPV